MVEWTGHSLSATIRPKKLETPEENRQGCQTKQLFPILPSNLYKKYTPIAISIGATTNLKLHYVNLASFEKTR